MTHMAKKLDIDRDLIYQWKRIFKIGHLNSLAGEALLKYCSNNVEFFSAARRAYELSQSIDLLRGGKQTCPCYDVILRLDEEHIYAREMANRLEGIYMLSTSAIRFKDELKRIFCKRKKAVLCQTCPAYDGEKDLCPILEFHNFFSSIMQKVEDLNEEQKR